MSKAIWCGIWLLGANLSLLGELRSQSFPLSRLLVRGRSHTFGEVILLLTKCYDVNRYLLQFRVLCGLCPLNSLRLGVTDCFRMESHRNLIVSVSKLDLDLDHNSKYGGPPKLHTRRKRMKSTSLSYALCKCRMQLGPLFGM